MKGRLGNYAITKSSRIDKLQWVKDRRMHIRVSPKRNIFFGVNLKVWFIFNF